MRIQLVAFLTLASICSLRAQLDARKIEGYAAASPPTIDGKLDDELWKVAPRTSGFVDPFAPENAVTDQTEVWIAYDANAIYLAWYCHDAQPNSIIAREVRPGASFDGEDFVVLRLDANFARDSSSISRYLVNALGTQSEEIAGGRAAKREWRGEWQAAAQRVEDGYTVEMRIPWKAINYPSGSNKRNLTVNFVRFHARQRLRSMWSNTTAADRPELDGIWTGVQPPQAAYRPKPSILIYSLGDLDGTNSAVDAGMDIKYAITPQMTLVGSLNPDFKNVEQAVESIEFSRSERFLGDTRPFFGEGSGMFDLTFEFGIGRLFYSRRIRDFDVGGKAYGRMAGLWSIAALSTFGRDNESNTVFNLLRQVGRGNVRFFGTNHASAQLRDTVLGAATTLVSGSWSVSGEYAREDGSVLSGAHSYELAYQIPRLFTAWRYSSVDPDFNPPLALIPFPGRRGWYHYAQYNDRYRGGWLSQLQGELYSSNFRRFDGSETEAGSDIVISLTTRNDQRINFGVEDFRYDGRKDLVFRGGLIFGTSNRFKRYSINNQAGKRGPDPYQFTQIGVTQRILKKLDLAFALAVQDYQGLEKQIIGTAGWEFDARSSVAGRVVVHNGKTNGYLAYRRSGFAGNEVFFILGNPNAQEFKQRAAIKFVWPF